MKEAAKPHFSNSISNLKRFCVQMAQFQQLDCRHLSANRKLVQVRLKIFQHLLGWQQPPNCQKKGKFPDAYQGDNNKILPDMNNFLPEYEIFLTYMNCWLLQPHTRSVSSTSYKEDLFTFLTGNIGKKFKLIDLHPLL